MAPAATRAFRRARLVHGPHNVSRWMTWLPISLKNAAKCDMWYQLQNHSITESLNANGAREKPSTGEPRACRNSQCRTTNLSSPRSSSRTSVGPRRETECKRVRRWASSVLCVARHAHNVARAGAWCRLALRVSRRARAAAVHKLLVKKRKPCFSFFSSQQTQKHSLIQFHTDLSAAGLPAKLKHITQRRKRKQP